MAAGGRLRAVPILHGRMEFAVEVRRAFHEYRPTHLAVELPGALERPFREAAGRLPALSVLEVTDSGAGSSPGGRDSFHLLVEPTDGLVEAVRLGMESGIPVVFADRDATRVTPVRQPIPDPHAVEAIGLDTYAGLCLALPVEPSDEEIQRQRILAHHLNRLLADEAARVLFIGSLPRSRAVLRRAGEESAIPFGRPPRLQAKIWHLHPDASREVLTEMPYLAGKYEDWRAGRLEWSAEGWPLPRHQVHLKLLAAARERFRREEGEEVPRQSVANLFRYARNCALLEGALAPDFYTLVLSARGFADDNFAWHVWDIGSSYPHCDAGDRRPALRITLEDLERSGRLVRFQRKIRRRRSALRLLRRRREEGQAREWKERWSGVSLCSHPPEDMVIEGLGRSLAHKAKGILTADRSRVEPFTASLLDGIDFRETIRNRSHDGRIYVRRIQPLKGEVGAVIVAFDAEDRDQRHPYRMTWQGEHDQESDMALYSTPPGEQVVGPGISRCEYGGFLLVWPPGRMFLVWEDPEFRAARTPAEHLLLAGIDYALERMVVYVGASPPRSFVRQYAARRDRKVVYLPMGQLSPLTLKRLRVFHVLDGRQVRAYAREYIW
jgi:hypothetical protein